MVNILL